MYLIDTNIAIALFAGDEVVKEKVGNAEFIAVSPTIIGELWYGAQKSQHVIQNLQKIDILTNDSIFYRYDFETAQFYGIIKERLERKGTLIPDNDIWIAAIALQHNLILVTRDAHFDEIESLQTERWQFHRKLSFDVKSLSSH